MKNFTCIALACVISAVVAGNVSANKILDTTENVALETAKTAVNHPATTATLLLM